MTFACQTERNLLVFDKHIRISFLFNTYVINLFCKVVRYNLLIAGNKCTMSG